MKRLRGMGPGLLITAAFIGPGTVTTATVAGAGFGFALLWAVLFSTVATIILQEMSARVGAVARMELGTAVRESFTKPAARVVAIVVVVSAIGLGSAAYEMGNITGAAIALESVTGITRQAWSLIIGAAAILLLSLGTYRRLERGLIVLVALMAVAFVATAIIVQPDASAIARGLFTPSIPRGSLLTVIALIGTTVVPYNLFLHASAVRAKWAETDDPDEVLRAVRFDAALSIAIGGMVTAAIVATAATVFAEGGSVESAKDMAGSFVPLLGPAAGPFFFAGLAAAGVTSAVTAPLAAAYATSGVLGWSGGTRSSRFRVVWIAIVLIGTILACVGTKPIAAILFAQAANGILLPIIAVFLIVVVNRRALMRGYANGVLANTLGAIVVLVTAGLGIFQLLRLFGVIDRA
jgi:NRAMP (natural resistance-associated macrophage protein)-like metal ion transporter